MKGYAGLPMHVALEGTDPMSDRAPALDAERLADMSKRLLDGLVREVIEAVIEGCSWGCSSPNCIADAVYEIVRYRLAAIAAEYAKEADR